MLKVGNEFGNEVGNEILDKCREVSLSTITLNGKIDCKIDIKKMVLINKKQ